MIMLAYLSARHRLRIERIQNRKGQPLAEISAHDCLARRCSCALVKGLLTPGVAKTPSTQGEAIDNNSRLIEHRLSNRVPYSTIG